MLVDSLLLHLECCSVEEPSVEELEQNQVPLLGSVCVNQVPLLCINAVYFHAGLILTLCIKATIIVCVELLIR